MYKIQYVRPDSTEFVERSFDEFSTARAFFTQRKATCDIVIFTETKVIEIAIKKNASAIASNR